MASNLLNEETVASSPPAHWSIGGLNLKRHRLQGSNIRTQREQISKESQNQQKFALSPQPPPLIIKRRRASVRLVEEAVETKKGLVIRKLGDDFERVARKVAAAKVVVLWRRGRKSTNGCLLPAVIGNRSSPWLAKTNFFA